VLPINLKNVADKNAIGNTLKAQQQSISAKMLPVLPINTINSKKGILGRIHVNVICTYIYISSLYAYIAVTGFIGNTATTLVSF
jgi:hypothetical protein